MTKFVKNSEIKSDWYEIDAKNAVVGRLAAIISKIIRGKNKNTFTPHMDHGDFVVVKNIEQIKFTGNKFQNKKYYKHTGYPGGIKKISFKDQLDKDPEKLIRDAVKGMLPKNRLNRQIIKKLKVYNDETHPHEAQNPEVIK